MEWAANLLVKNYRHVLIRASYMNHTRIRFRADNLVDERVFFNKVPSQHAAWVEQGGALISWKFRGETHPHEAIVFVECPKFTWMLREGMAATQKICVIYEPPTWKAHEQQIVRACEKHHPGRLKRQLRQFKDMQLLISQLPEFTAQRLATVLRRDQEEASRLSSFPSLSGAGARLPDTHD